MAGKGVQWNVQFGYCRFGFQTVSHSVTLVGLESVTQPNGLNLTAVLCFRYVRAPGLTGSLQQCLAAGRSDAKHTMSGGMESIAEPKKGSETNQPGTGELVWPVKEREESEMTPMFPAQIPEGLWFIFLPMDDIFPATHRNLF